MDQRAGKFAVLAHTFQHHIMRMLSAVRANTSVSIPAVLRLPKFRLRQKK